MFDEDHFKLYVFILNIFLIQFLHYFQKISLISFKRKNIRLLMKGIY